MTRSSVLEARGAKAAALFLLFTAPILFSAGGVAASATGEPEIALVSVDVDPEAWCAVRDRWINHLLEKYPEGTWAPMRLEPTDEDLAVLGLPPREFLIDRKFPEPMMVSKDGDTTPVDLTQLSNAIQQFNAGVSLSLASFAGNGCLGIRPGAWILLLDGGIGWCSAAHVFGSPGAYDISTAGHCGKNGDRATVIAALGNREGVLQPILLDFGTFSRSHDNGPGSDWALIDIIPSAQPLVTPTMCFWGGPRGQYTKTGSTVAVQFPRRSFIPKVSLSTDPLLAQDIVHYGHGAGLGTGGTPRSGINIHWASSYHTFWGALTPGDSGSGSNTLAGDTVGTTMEGAGIMTHIWVDPLMRNGVGIMIGTRVTQVSGTMANGQLLPYPAPLPVAP